MIGSIVPLIGVLAVTEDRYERYRRISVQLGERDARALLDRLQVLALTQPDALREFETFLDRSPTTPRLTTPTVDRRQNPDRRTASVAVPVERRRGPRRASDRST
jgi:hypothetical protein